MSSRSKTGGFERGAPHARLRVRSRRVPGADLWPIARWAAVLTLLLALLSGGSRWSQFSSVAGAIEFTSHVAGIETGAVGVLGVATGDVDGDGDSDVVTAGLDGVKVYENTGGSGNNRFSVRIVDEGVDGERVQVIDIDGDDALDLLVTHAGNDGGVVWYRNEGEFNFDRTAIGATGRSAAAFAGDINGDGTVDVAIATDDGGAVTLRRWMNAGGGVFTATVVASNTDISTLTIGNADGDGYADIVTGGEKGLQRWDTSDGLTWSQVDVDTGNKNKSHVAVAYPDEDRTWIVTADEAANAVAVYRSTDPGTFQRIQLKGDIDAKTVQPVDLDTDGDIDVVATGQDGNEVVWFDNNGTDEFAKRTIATKLQSVFGVGVVDLDGDSDVDVIAGDHFRGTVYWYERTQVRPKATAPTEITQSTNGSGLVTFSTTISDEDFDTTRIRVQYSPDGGKTWDKPWLTKAVVDTGSVNLTNSHAFQIGTDNPIDTDDAGSVQVTLTWDTKSTQNTGGPLVGEVEQVQLRVLPRDSKGYGEHAVSGTFRVDNEAPRGVGGLAVTAVDQDTASLLWERPRDASAFTYEVYYGTDHAAVLEQRSTVWNIQDDSALEDVETTTTDITGLTLGQTYTFKLFVADIYGNRVAAPSVRTALIETVAATPSPVGSVSPSPTSTPTSTPTPTPTTVAFPSPSPSVPVFVLPSPSPTPPPKVPSVLESNRAPVADAGIDQVVNPLALVILDGTASFDPDQDILTYSWRQLSGPIVELVSERTATPSFSAGDEYETYIFAVTVRDANGATATDTVTVATRAIIAESPAPVVVTEVEDGDDTPRSPVPQEAPWFVRSILLPLDIILLVLSALSVALLLLERVLRLFGDRQGNQDEGVLSAGRNQPQGRVVHYKTGDGIAGVQVLVYGADGKLRRSQRTNNQGVFETYFPAGQYTVGVEAEGFTMAPAASRALVPDGGIMYTGGTLRVQDPNTPLSIVVPLKPTATTVGSFRTFVLQSWQWIQHVGRLLSWPVLVVGALLNTFLIFFAPRPLYLVIEGIYIALVLVKIVLEIRTRPAYGLVRDAITHVPLDLAVVRLFDSKTNRLIMTRVTNNQGKFFALPPPGVYTVTISKPGYATFSRQQVEIQAEQDATLQMTADLMPLAPQTGSLRQAGAAVV